MTLDEVGPGELFDLLTSKQFITALCHAGYKAWDRANDITEFFVTRDSRRVFEVGAAASITSDEEEPVAHYQIKLGENYPFLYTHILPRNGRGIIVPSFGFEDSDSSLLTADGHVYDDKNLTLLMWKYKRGPLYDDSNPLPKQKFNPLQSLEEFAKNPRVSKVPLTPEDIAAEDKDIKRSNKHIHRALKKPRIYSQDIKQRCQNNEDVIKYLRENQFSAWLLEYAFKGQENRWTYAPQFGIEAVQDFRARVDLESAINQDPFE